MELILLKSEHLEIKRKYLELFLLFLGLCFITLVILDYLQVNDIFILLFCLLASVGLISLFVKRHKDVSKVKNKIRVVENLLKKVKIETNMQKGSLYTHMITRDRYECVAVGYFLTILSGSSGTKYSLTKTGEKLQNELVEANILPERSTSFFKEEHLQKVS